MGKQSRIGLAGYFGFGNYGDELFVKVLTELFDAYEVIVIPKRLPPPFKSRQLSELVESVDAIVIGGGDLVIPWEFCEYYWNEIFLRKPVYICGVGVPTNYGPSGRVLARTKRFFHHYNVKYIVGRDDRSRRWIQRHLRPIVPVRQAPDIACSLDFPIAKENGLRLGLVTRALLDRGSAFDASNLKGLCVKAVRLGYTIRHIVLGTDRTLEEDLLVAQQLDLPEREIIVSNSQEELTAELARCSVVASMRFHGCLAACMMGLPAISLFRGHKFTGFFEQAGISTNLSCLLDPDLENKLTEPMLALSQIRIGQIKRAARLSLANLKAAVEHESR